MPVLEKGKVSLSLSIRYRLQSCTCALFTNIMKVCNTQQSNTYATYKSAVRKSHRLKRPYWHGIGISMPRRHSHGIGMPLRDGLSHLTKLVRHYVMANDDLAKPVWHKPWPRHKPLPDEWPCGVCHLHCSAVFPIDSLSLSSSDYNKYEGRRGKFNNRLFVCWFQGSFRLLSGQFSAIRKK